LLKEMLRMMPGGALPAAAGCGVVPAGGAVALADGPTLMLIGPVTSLRTRFEKDMFSKRVPGLPWNFSGQP
jgi:hypothetical protein